MGSDQNLAISKIFYLFLHVSTYIQLFLSNLNSNCSNLSYLRNIQEQVKKHSVTKNWSDLSRFEQIVLVISKSFANSRPSALNFKRFYRSLEQFFLTVGQYNFGNKIPFLDFHCVSWFGWILFLLSLKYNLSKKLSISIF